jgi:alpha-D-ribose 1-methylphosphonate 5-triphosphate synthase subunit PhnL
MEKVIYQSPKKHRIIAIQDLLIKNNIPVTSIKLHICINSGGGRGGVVQIARSDELNVPIENFNEILNDLQSFEIYVDEHNEAVATELVTQCDEETFFDDCVYKSKNYDEALEIYFMLTRNKVPCDEVCTVYAHTDSEEYLLFTGPEHREKAIQMIKGENEAETKVRAIDLQTDNLPPEEFSGNEKQEKNIFKYIIPLLVIACLLLLRVDNQFIIEIIIKKVALFLTH